MAPRVSTGALARAAAVHRRALATAAALIAAGALVACGSERLPPVNLKRPAQPQGFERYRSPDGDVKLRAPASWAVSPGQPPAVVTFSSGHAAITVWSYPRVAVPETEADAELAERLLVRSLRKRAPKFELTGRRAFEIGGARAVEIEGRGTIAKRPVRVRSVHLYKDKGEYVIDAYAQPSQFRLADREVFQRVIRGVRVGGDPPRIKKGRPEAETPAVPRSFGGP